MPLSFNRQEIGPGDGVSGQGMVLTGLELRFPNSLPRTQRVSVPPAGYQKFHRFHMAHTSFGSSGTQSREKKHHLRLV